VAFSTRASDALPLATLAFSIRGSDAAALSMRVLAAVFAAALADNKVEPAAPPGDH
jgi:hypothetical protein